VKEVPQANKKNTVCNVNFTSHDAPGGGKKSVGGFKNFSAKFGILRDGSAVGAAELHAAKASAETIPSHALQHTIRNQIGCSGVGLHSGADVNLMLHPAPVGTGIVFRRTDISGNSAEIVATVGNVVDAKLGTTIGNADGATVATIEHLMAALRGASVDNLVVELDGPEVPIMDGSAAPFLFLVECAGIEAQIGSPRRAIEVLKPIEVTDGEKRASIVPGPGFSLEFEIDFDSSVIGHQNLGVQLVNGNFKDIISRARTFGFTHEVEQLRALGLARGGSLENAIVISSDGVLNEEGLRFDNEFVRHKILDSIGDLYLAGAPIIGHFYGVRSGHALNHQLLTTLLADASAWRYSVQAATSDLHSHQQVPVDDIGTSVAVA
jgi:UDP-3-O-[3-hydroxymyristoyl] N-acetylglucosamine deacetylase